MCFQLALRYFFLSFLRTVSSFSRSFSSLTRALRTPSICLRNCWARCSMRSSVISSSLKITSSRTVRSPALSWSPMRMTALMIAGMREIDLITESLPRSMRLAMATSPSRVSSGTVPISRRYIRTGSLVLSSAPGREVELHAVFGGPGRTLAALHRVALAVALLGVDQVDAGVAEHREQLVQVLGIRGQLGRQDVVHLVVEEIALFLADDDELADFFELVFERQGRYLRPGMRRATSFAGHIRLQGSSPL